MKTFDFSKGKRGPVINREPESEGKTEITIRLDEDIVDHFLARADETGGKVRYYTLINQALREYINGTSPTLETMLRRVLREELQPH
jgi:uncharacterized protein (DUF4415 family)